MGVCTQREKKPKENMTREEMRKSIREERAEQRKHIVDENIGNRLKPSGEDDNAPPNHNKINQKQNQEQET